MNNAPALRIRATSLHHRHYLAAFLTEFTPLNRWLNEKQPSIAITLQLKLF